MTRTGRYTACAALLLLAGGCAKEDPHRLVADFGNSVHSMVDGQIYDTKTIDNPSIEAPKGQDGERAKKVLKTYRGDVEQGQNAKQPIQLQIGQ